MVGLESCSCSSGLYAALTFHHARLEASARHVLSKLRLEGPAAARKSFESFKRELDAHLEAEEAWVLPAFARARPDACAAIRAEHARVRQAAEAFERSVEGEGAERALHELLDRLLYLCHLEERDLCKWTETEIGEAESRAVLQKIEQAELGERESAT